VRKTENTGGAWRCRLPSLWNGVCFGDNRNPPA